MGRYRTVRDVKAKPKRPQTFTYHNTQPRGTDGSYIRPFTNTIAFKNDPWCGCCVVYAPGYYPEQPVDKPFLLKFRYLLCSANPRH